MSTDNDSLPSDNTDAGQDTGVATDTAAENGDGDDGEGQDTEGAEGGEPAKPNRINQRFSELTRQRNDAAARAEQLEIELAAERAARGANGNDDGEEIDLKTAIRQELEAERATTSYKETVNTLQQKLMDSGLEGAMLVASGDPSVPFSRAMIEIAADLENPAQVADYLGKNPAEARRIAALPPHKMGVEMAKLEAKATTAPTPVSKAPSPVSGLKTGATASTGPSDSQSIDDWMAKRNAQVYGKR